MGKLTPHFTLEELIASETAKARGIANTPGPAHLANLMVLALGLEMCRACIDKPIKVSSGYRNPKVNRLVGGVPTSDHALGFAADLEVAGMSDLDLARLLVGRLPTWDQLIYERGRTVHVSFNPRLRRQVLTQVGGPGSAFLSGIVP